MNRFGQFANFSLLLKLNAVLYHVEIITKNTHYYGDISVHGFFSSQFAI